MKKLTMTMWFELLFIEVFVELNVNFCLKFFIFPNKKKLILFKSNLFSSTI